MGRRGSENAGYKDKKSKNMKTEKGAPLFQYKKLKRWESVYHENARGKGPGAMITDAQEDYYRKAMWQGVVNAVEEKKNQIIHAKSRKGGGP